MTLERQQQDLDLWREWKRTKNPQTLQKLLDRLQPLIYRETSKWSGAVPAAALDARAKRLVVEALDSYNPNMGAAIGTHVTSRLRKVSRHVYPYQNVARMPENKQLLYHTYQVASSSLQDSLGREPTVEELQDELGWGAKKIREFNTSIGRRELVESEGADIHLHDTEASPLVDFYYHGLIPSDKSLFEDIVGYGGKKTLSNPELIRKYGMTQGQLSHKKRKFTDDLLRIQQGRA